MRLGFGGCVLVFVMTLSGCDLLDEPCPSGYWRPRAMMECEPIPAFDAGTVDAGRDGGTIRDGSADAASDASLPDADAPDGAADAARGDGGTALDAAAGDAAASDASLPDASPVGDAG